MRQKTQNYNEYEKLTSRKETKNCHVSVKKETKNCNVSVKKETFNWCRERMVCEKASLNIMQCIAHWYPIYRVPATIADYA